VSKALTHRATAAESTAAGTRSKPRRSLTRGQVLAGGTASAGALVAGGIVLGGLPRLAISKPSTAQDRRVLEWLLEVEQLEAAFYTEVEERGALSGDIAEFAELVGEHERAHVDAIEKALGGSASESPEFDFGDTTSDPEKFLPTAVRLEEIALAAFNGQVPNLTPKRLLLAMKIASVEGRHVGWARDLAGRNPAPRPADRPATEAQARSAMKDAGFV
jgi:Ferritin-like domain